MPPPVPKPPLSPFITFLPMMVPPACKTRVTTVASKSGMKPSRAKEPKLIGIPASAMWSLKLTVLPFSRPSAAPSIRHFHIQALSGSSSGLGRLPGFRPAETIGGPGSSTRVLHEGIELAQLLHEVLSVQDR